MIHTRDKNGNFNDLTQVATTGFEDVLEITKSLNLLSIV